MNSEKKDSKTLEAELKEHLDIMDQLSKVRGHECSYFYINGDCHYWRVDGKLGKERLIEIARRQNHEELMLMIRKYGEAAPRPNWDEHKWCNPYDGEHHLPDEVQEIIAERCNDEELEMFTRFEGFGLAGQRKFYQASSHEQRMRYLQRHGFDPEIQDKLRADGNRKEVELHISRHGMHFGWEKDVIESDDSVRFRHCVGLHEFSIEGQRLMCQRVNESNFLFYIERWGLWNENHDALVQYRSCREVEAYIRRHRYLSYDGEDALIKRPEYHELRMLYISLKCGKCVSMLQLWGVNYGDYPSAKLTEKKFNDYIAIAACMRRDGLEDRLSRVEIPLMTNGSEAEIIEYMKVYRPTADAVKVLLERHLEEAIRFYCQKWPI